MISLTLFIIFFFLCLKRAISLNYYQTFKLYLVGLGGVGLFVGLELHGCDRGKKHLYHPYDPRHLHPTPPITIHTEQFINKIFIKLSIFLIILSLRMCQTLVNTRFMVLKYIHSVATLLIFYLGTNW